MEVHEVLRTERAKRGEGLRALAHRVGVDPAYLSRVECGKRRASRALLSSLAGVLGLSEERLLVLGGYLPDSWREAAERGAKPKTLLVSNSNEEYAPRVAEPGVQFGSERTLAQLERLSDPLADLVPTTYLASPEINEVYELKLALLEASMLDRRAVLDRGAYFLAVDGEPTRHFRICTGGGLQLPHDSGTRLRSFLATHQFKTGYATHGLFPYRGKFHPQMVKALLNVMGLQPGEVVLDPMAGSGTTSVESALMGIDSIAVDASPFCTFLTRTKVAALGVDLGSLLPTVRDPTVLGRTFRALSSKEGVRRARDANYMPRGMSRAAFELLVLAFLDARGYAERSTRKTAESFFADILGKYLATVERFQGAWAKIGAALGNAHVLEGDARSLELPDESVDGVLFSPPYCFAVDYLANDASHLAYLGVDIPALRARMIGLNGRDRSEQVAAYFDDMRLVLGQVARVLKPKRVCTLVVGSNSRQLGAAMGADPASPEVRYGLEARLIETAENHGLHLELSIRRLIVGIANSMREEHILMLRKAA